MKRMLKNIVTGELMQEGSLENDWQEFVLKRISAINDENIKEIDLILDKLDDPKLANKIREGIIDSLIKKGYVRYNHGFSEGLKMAIINHRERVLS